MEPALADVVPLALGIAASPFPVIPAILVLFSARPRPAGASFLAGWAAGILVVCLVSAALASVIEFADEPPTWLSWTRIGIGLLLVVLAILQWRKRGKDAEPVWMQTLQDATPATAARLGLMLSAANPKIVVLAAAGGLAIGAGEPAVGPFIASVAAFTAIASCTVALPLLLHLVLGDRVLGPLGRARDWLKANNAAVMAVVLLVLAALLITKGIDGL